MLDVYYSCDQTFLSLFNFAIIDVMIISLSMQDYAKLPRKSTENASEHIDSS